jgi:hypothetical protein
MEPDFPKYDEVRKNALPNYTRLRVFLERYEPELAREAEREKERMPKPFTNKKARLLFRHFRREVELKRARGRRYAYTPIGEEELRLVLPTSVEDQASRLAAADTRVRLLEQLHESDMRELAALITEFRQRGLVTDVETNAILEKVTSQCDPLREENRHLRQQLEEGGRGEALGRTYQVVIEDLEVEKEALRGEVAELRALLAECDRSGKECELVRDLNERLLQRPGEETLTDLRRQVLELRVEALERESVNEAQGRELAEKTRLLQAKQTSDLERAWKDQLLAVQEEVIEKGEERLYALESLHEEQKREIVSLRQRLNQGDTRELRQEVLTTLTQFRESASSNMALLSERLSLVEEELQGLRELPISTIDEEGHLVPTGATVARYLDDDKDFYLVDADALDRLLDNAGGSHMPVKEGYPPTEEEIATEGLLRGAAKGQAGTGRVALLFTNMAGERELELVVHRLAPQRVGTNGPVQWVVDFSQTERLEYRYQGLLPGRVIRHTGRVRVERYEGSVKVGPTREHAYTLNGKRSLVRFEDGTALYATQISPSLYRLDLLVLPQ